MNCKPGIIGIGLLKYHPYKDISTLSFPNPSVFIQLLGYQFYKSKRKFQIQGIKIKKITFPFFWVLKSHGSNDIRVVFIHANI